MKIIATRVSKIRVSHQCFWCQNKMSKGTNMLRYTMRYDGKLSSMYECFICAKKSKGEKANLF